MVSELNEMAPNVFHSTQYFFKRLLEVSDYI